MRYLLDTDTFSEIARGTNPKLMQSLRRTNMSLLALSLVSVGEVRFGQALQRLPERLAARIDELLAVIPTLPLDTDTVPHYANLRAHLHRLGKPIGPNDLWIAAHALAEGLILVTGSEREYARVPGLKVENWLR